MGENHSKSLLLDKVERYLDRGLYDEAIKELKGALKLHPDYPEFHNALGRVYYLKNMLKEASIEFDKAIQLDPNYGEAYFNLATLLSEAGLYESAFSLYNKYITLSSGKNLANADFPENNRLSSEELNKWRYISICSEDVSKVHRSH